MLKYARSLLDSVLGRKRALDEEPESSGSANVEYSNKKLKVEDDTKMVYKVYISNIPTCTSSAIKKYLADKGIPRISKSPQWDYAIATYKVLYKHAIEKTD
jgi:tRNA (uracil-5-)-methyltransferase